VPVRKNGVWPRFITGVWLEPSAGCLPVTGRTSGFCPVPSGGGMVDGDPPIVDRNGSTGLPPMTIWTSGEPGVLF
jgi:hypothetical protein